MVVMCCAASIIFMAFISGLSMEESFGLGINCSFAIARVAGKPEASASTVLTMGMVGTCSFNMALLADFASCNSFSSTSILLHSSSFSVSTTDAGFEHSFCFEVFESLEASEGCCSKDCFADFCFFFFE